MIISLTGMILRAAKRLADGVQVIDMQIDQTAERVLAGEADNGRVQLAVHRQLSFTRPVFRVHLADKGLGERMPIPADLHPPFAPAFCDGRHDARLQSARLKTPGVGTIRAQAARKHTLMPGIKGEQMGTNACAQPLESLRKYAGKQ